MKRTKELAEFTRKLAMFARKGIPLDKAIINIEDDLKDKNLKKAFDRLASNLARGDSFWVALESTDHIYPASIRKFIQAGEMDGDLPGTLREAAEYLSEFNELEDDVRVIIRQPAIPVNLICLFAAFIFMVITPAVIKTSSGFGLELPLITRIAIRVTDLFHNGSFLVLYFGLLILFNFLIFTGNPIRNYILYNTTAAGNLIRKLYTYQVARLSSMMLGGGITVNDALTEISKDIKMESVRKAIENVSAEMSQGKSFPVSARSKYMFPELFRWMMGKIDNEGRLYDFLNVAANYYKDDIGNAISKMGYQYNHSFIIVVVGIMFIIIAALFVPMYQVIGILQ